MVSKHPSGDPACAREGRLPGLRSDCPAAGSLASDCARPRGPKLLAHVLFARYGLYLPLNRQSDVYQREGIDLDVSTFAQNAAERELRAAAVGRKN